MGRRVSGRVTAALALLASSPTYAFTPTVSGSGVPVRWSGTPRLPLAGNPVNRSGIDPQSFFNAVVRGLQRWQAASFGGVTFDYWQGTDPSVYEPNSDYNGLSSIYFASNASANPGLSANVLGLTQVWYDTNNGRILEADVVLNDLSYHFTTNPRDTSGYGSGGASGRNVYIENVITHELGHAFGLSHSGGLQTTMLFMESPEQAYLGCDEQSGIRAVYRGSASDGAGSIVGTVLAEETQAPIFGAQVQAISRTQGTVLSSAITDHLGKYSMGQLSPGTYYLMVEPFYAGSSALPGYYSGLSPVVCSGGRTFGRSFLTDPSHPNIALAVEVGASNLTSAPDLTARCSSGGIAAVVPLMSGTENASRPPIVFAGSRGGFGIADRFENGGTRSYLLENVSGHLQLNALGYSLYSPVSLTISLRQANGMAIDTAQAVVPLYTSQRSGYVNHDAALVVDELPSGNYVVQVAATRLNASEYPAGPVSIDSVPFFLLTGSVNESGESRVQVSSQSRCLMNESFPLYASPPGGPPRQSVEEKSKAGFCGNIEIVRRGSGREGDGSSGPGAGAGEIAGWFLPWTLMLAMLRGRRLAAILGG